MLEVPGAQLYYEVRNGGGPLLLLIPGGTGDADSYAALADQLGATHTVVSYDRRGFARSPLTAPVADSERIVADVDDAVRLIDRLGGGAATVLGSSSGAIVALELLAHHPEHVGTMVAHEPPLMTLLPDAADQFAFAEHVDAIYRRDGLHRALVAFAEGMGIPVHQPGLAGTNAEPEQERARTFTNLTYWMEHEKPVYPRLSPNLATLHTHATNLLLAVGEDCRLRNSPPYRATMALADQLGLAITDFAGGHLGYRTDPAAFAGRLLDILTNRPTAPYAGRTRS